MPMNQKPAEDLSFGEWLRQRRHILDMTQQELADQVGCARITLRRLESGALRPSKELTQILLEKLGIPEAKLEAWLRFARGLSGLPETSPESVAKQPLTNLPIALSSFIGREKEQQEIANLLDRHRLVTLIGPGGVGKTRLSLEVAQRILEKYAEGVWLVELAPILDPSLVPRTTAIAIGLRDEPQRPVADMLSDYLRAKQMLILFDNCEHVVDACAQLVATLLKNCPDLKILATSRESLGIMGEATYHVPSLGLPGMEQLLEKIRDYESVRLFEERAQLVQLGFLVTKENAFPVAKICSQLDGIPLAIELAAARVKMLSTEQIAARLQESFDLLTTGNRAALPRHQTLQAAIDWSFDLLSPAERILFRRLSVFVNDWTLEAAEFVCSDENIKSEDVLDLLTQLLNKSLVNTEGLHNETRYRMLETIRQYAHEKLVYSGESHLLKDHHLDYFLTLAEMAAPYLIRPEQLEWLARLDADYDNLRAALEWTLSKDSPEPSLRLCAALGMFWEIRGFAKEGSKWLEKSLAKPTLNADLNERLSRVRALYTDAQLASSLDNIQRMQASAEASLRLGLEVSDRKDVAIARFYVGQVKRRFYELEEARALSEKSLVEMHEISELYWEMRIYLTLGFLLVRMGEKNSEQVARENLEFARKVGERLHLAYSLVDVAYQTYRRGRVEEGEAILEQADTLFYQIGLAPSTLLDRGVIAHTYRHDYEKAKTFYMSYVDRCNLLGDKHARNLALQLLASLEIDVGNLEQARIYLEESLVLAREVGYKSFISVKLLLLEYVLDLQGKHEKSQDSSREAILAIRESRNQLLKLGSLQILADRVGRRTPEIGAKLLGAIYSWRKLKNEPLDLVTKSFHDRAETHIHKALNEAVFRSSFEGGKNMSLDDALDLALKTLEEI